MLDSPHLIFIYVLTFLYLHVHTDHNLRDQLLNYMLQPQKIDFKFILTTFLLHVHIPGLWKCGDLGPFVVGVVVGFFKYAVFCI